MTTLFSKLNIGKLEIKNRIAMAPMCMYISDDSGYVNDFHFVHYATRAMGGTGLIILEATAVEPCGRLSGNDLGIWSDDHISGLNSIVEQAKKYNATVGIQLNHAGRKCGAESEKRIIAPSPIAFSSDYKTPIEMTKDDIQRVTQLFANAAKRAEKANFDYVEIHAAHGYLLSQFLSPLSNKRTDNYGGSHENRARFLGEVVEAVKSNFKGCIGIRVSAEDYTPGGNHPSDLSLMINTIKSKGVEIINVSSGGVVQAKINSYPGYQIKFAEEIKKACLLPVMGGGLLLNEAMMDEALCNDRLDMVYLGRLLLRDPYFPLKAAHELKSEIEWIKSYEGAKYR